MKRFYLIFAILFLFFNCSKNDSEDVLALVESIYPTQTFIGDTLTLTGQNLLRLSKITMRNEDVDLANQVNSFISQSDTEIKFIVPELYHENVTVYTTSDNPGLEIELFGFIPYSYPNNGTEYRHAQINQIFNDDIAFFEKEVYGDERFKLTNSYTTKSSLPLRDEEDIEIYYATEDSGWILAASAGYNNSAIYSFENNINNRNLEYNISGEDILLDRIKQIEFLSNNSAYIMYRDGIMFRVTDGEVTSFSDLYPDLSNTPYLSNEYMENTFSFEVIEDGTIVISPGNQNYILRINDTNVNAIYFDTTVRDLRFYDNEGSLYSNQKIYKTVDYGITWTEFENRFALGESDGIQYLGGSQYLIYQNDSFNFDYKIYISLDNCNSWELIYSWSIPMGLIELYENYGFGWRSNNGLLKFRKFPNGF